MSIATLPSSDVFRTETVRGLPSAARVDRKSGMIFGAKAMQVGPLNLGDDRPWKVDATTLEQLAALGNAKGSGTKMRFAHPNMSRDGMGRHLGRATNFKIEGEGDAAYVAIDAKLSEAAKRTPNGDLHSHVLDLAEETPEDFGLSIAPILDREAMNKIEPDANGLKPIRIKGLSAVDFVDEPAATRGGLFSLDSDSLADLPAQATWMLDTFFDSASPDVIRARFDAFLETYFKNRGTPMSATATPAPVIEPAAAPSATVTNPPAAPLAAVVAPDAAAQLAAQKELTRRSEVSALCKLAKVPDDQRDLMLTAGFDRAAAQDYLKSSGQLSANNPPIGEGSDPLGAKETPSDKFGKEFDQFAAVYERQGVTRDQFVQSRMVDEGLATLATASKK